MRPVPAPGLSYRLGRGVVALRPDGSIESVRPRSGSGSYLAGGGRVRVWIDQNEVSWSVPTVAADVDEVEFGYASPQGLGLVVRHSFAIGWSVRVAFVNHTPEPLSFPAELTWVPAPECPAWALAAGATGAYAIPGPAGGGPLLGGELVIGTCDQVSEDGLGLGRVELGPLERRGTQWRWDWYANPRVFNRVRFLEVPRDLVLPENETARIAADDDAAVVAPSLDLVRRGSHLEFSSMGGHRVRVEVRSHRGVTAYDMEWVDPLDEVLPELGDQVLAGPRNRSGVIRLADVDAALVIHHLLARNQVGDPEEAEDALALFVSRLADRDVVDGRGVSLLCGESERANEADLLDRATAALLRLDRVPGLGLAAAQVCVARLAAGRPVDPVLHHLATVTAAAEAADELDAVAVALELRLLGTLRAEPGRAVETRIRRVGTALGAGLRGRPVRPLPVDRQAYLAVALGLLLEDLGARSRPEWGVGPHEIARTAQAEVLARLGRQPPRAAHSWLILGARLA